VAHICKILNSQGIITICSFISPDEDIRKQVQEIIGKELFHLVYMDSDLEFSQKNKPELYQLSDEGKISGLPGVDIPYETPASPSLICKPDTENLESITGYLAKKKIFPAS
jgi:bifunctional enzyme CysN/CysC